MREIALSSGFVALVDDADYPALSQHKWSAAKRANGRTYAVRRERIGPGRWRMLLMHRVLLGLSEHRTPDVDHINGVGIDNRRSNLRIASRSQNNANQAPQTRAKSSRFKGVSWLADKQRWRASIKLNGRTRHLGAFRSEEEAAAAYDAAARETFGDFARPNGAFR